MIVPEAAITGGLSCSVKLSSEFERGPNPQALDPLSLLNPVNRSLV